MKRANPTFERDGKLPPRSAPPLNFTLEVMITAIAFVTFIVGSIVFCAMSVPFIREMRTEFPQLYSSYGFPTVGVCIWRNAIFMPYSKLILFRYYSHVLKDAPNSLHWASRLFFVHWVQLIALVVFCIEVMRAWFHF